MLSYNKISCRDKKSSFQTLVAYDLKGEAVSSLDIPDSHIVKIILYTMDGTPVFSGTPSEFENQTFKRGIYIKEIILDNGESRTSKVLFK